ncbi:MAG: hypothetical protein KDB95_01630 [Flavobacteriales bacterium]|nr:hypothetical protein [Flavobacteriales bacterium]
MLALSVCSIGIHAQSDESKRFVHEVLQKGDILPTELKDSLIDKDFSVLWTKAPNWLVYGFIGNDYQRLRMKLLSVIMDPDNPNRYHVYGKDKVKNNICEFQGEFEITNIRRYNDIDFGLDEIYRDSSIHGRFLVCGTYRLLEDPIQRFSGTFTGSFASYFYIDRNGKVRYDDIEDVADGYTNNQFVGTWQPYHDGPTKRCNWGDFRIPNGRDMDIGAGCFSPADEYLANGWRSYRDAYFGSQNDKAFVIEREEWWR